MEAFLIDAWLGHDDPIPIRDEASVSLARERARAVAAAAGLNAVEAGRLASIASELGHNHLAHARNGQIAIRATTRGEYAGVEICAADQGDGIADPTRALQGVARISGSLGVGFAAIREQSDELDVDVRRGEGTCVRARVFHGNAPRRREVGVFGRPYQDEPKSGDHAWFLREEGRLLVAVCDGLGHGPLARDASATAIGVFARQRGTSPRAIIEECHASLGPTRGAVMAVAALGESDAPTLDIASVGNIASELIEPRTTRRFGASSFVLGSSQRGWRPHVEVVPLPPRAVFMACSDGISSRAAIDEDLDLLREHPIVIAHQLVERFGRDNDDVLVLVAR